MYNNKYHYYIISKNDGLCFQYINSDVAGWSIDNENDYSICMDGHYNIAGCYFIDGVWYRRSWNEIDEHGIPVEMAGYVDEAFTPSLIESRIA